MMNDDRYRMIERDHDNILWPNTFIAKGLPGSGVFETESA
jgi:hypothetical protein